MKITKDAENLIITVPLKCKRSNPWDDTYSAEMDNIVGLVEEEYNDWGFAYLIDMEYKGKADQTSDWFCKYPGSLEEFIALCKELNIGIINII